MQSRPACRYEVRIDPDRTTIRLRQPPGGPSTHRFAAQPSVAADVDSETDGTAVTFEADDELPAIDAEIVHPTVREPRVGSSLDGYRVGLSPGSVSASALIDADRPIVAADRRTPVPYRKTRVDGGVHYRGAGELALSITVGDAPPDRLRADGYRLATGADGIPSLRLEPERFDSAFGSTVPVTRVGGIAYLDESATTPDGSLGRLERCQVRPPEFDDCLADRDDAGRYVVVDATLAALVGCEPGMQLLIDPDRGRSALFTVLATVDQSGETVRMTADGRERVGIDDEIFGATLSPIVASPIGSRDEIRRRGGFIERLREGSTAVVASAPHGGGIEVNTDRQAHRLADRLGATAWCCEGWCPDGDAFERFHVRSSDLSPASFPLLSRAADRDVDRAISFHCHADEGIVVGGRASEAVLRAVGDRIAETVADEGIDVAYEGRYMGRRAENFVNWVTDDGESGIQLEQSPYAVSNCWRAVADAAAAALSELA